MSHRTREIFGWVLVAIGLLTFAVTYLAFLRRGLIFESGPLTFIGYVIFRGGIHLLKVATAARVCEESRPQAVSSLHAVPVPPRVPVVGQKPSAVLPGPGRKAGVK
jgi:hypothetical protein